MFRKVNTAPQTSETLGKELLTYYGDTFITDPPLNKVNIRIGVGIDIKVSKATKGVKVKDVIDAIYTKYGKKFVCILLPPSQCSPFLTPITEEGRRPRASLSRRLHLGRGRRVGHPHRRDAKPTSRQRDGLWFGQEEQEGQEG